MSETVRGNSPACASAGPGAIEVGAVIPVVEEALEIGRREVETGRVRVTKLVREAQELVDLPVHTDEVHVERVPIGRIVNGPVGSRQEGDTLILPVVEEVLVVEKRLRLVEEVRITRKRTEARNPQTVTLRKEEVQIERLSPDAPRQDA